MYQEVYREGEAKLIQAGIDEAALDARLLLEYVCGTDRNTLLAHGDREVTEKEYGCYCDLIVKRAGHIPLQHLTGEQEFMGLTFVVNNKVLVPRQDTEVLVEEALRHLHDGIRILDMCTGSGCILLSLLQYSNDCTGTGVDLSPEALKTAEANYRRLREQRPEMEACFIESDLFAGLHNGEQYEMIVSNPPYIRTDVIDTLMPEVREHEPWMALDGREDGLYFYREITRRAGEYLTRGGMLFYEIGYDQAKDVCKIMENEGFREIEVVKDFAGLDRVVYGNWFG
ncbi:peptide chain release factor N(5)-glutamine methyltransferase [bacterium 0.1xD8-71]|nr:peptide chain release factor N(5)-glutamine methyltransferase [bacterium 0.1xD8-71]